MAKDKHKKKKERLERRLHAINIMNVELLKYNISLQARILDKYNILLSPRIKLSDLYAVFSEDNTIKFVEKRYFSKEINSNSLGIVDVKYYYLKDVFNNQNIFETTGWTIYNLPWTNEKKFNVNNTKSIAIKAEKIIPPRLLHKNGTIDDKKLREIQVCMSEYMIEHPEYINMFFRKEKEYKKNK